MQKTSNHINTRLQKRAKRHLAEDVEHSNPSDGEYVAKIFKYYRGWQNPYRTTIIPLKLVSGKTIYKKHKELFDAFAAKAKKNNFDIDAFIKYCVINRGINESCIVQCLSSTTMLNEFYNHLNKKHKLNNIYRWFMKSVKNIVAECLDLQICTTKDFFRQLIKDNKVGAYVMSGKISLYYLAAIPSFKKVIEHLDYFSKLELQSLNDHFEIYHSDVNEAFLAKKHKMVNPIELTDLAILKALNKK